MNQEFYTDLYNDLYNTGYHNNLELSHSKKLFPILKDLVPIGETILDVGCSHGLAVQQLRTMGYNCYGIDVAYKAIDMCEKRGLTTCTQSSVLDIPFPNSFFHSIISTDMLEHLLPKDVPQALNEMNRVIAHYCIVTIATDAEGNTTPLKTIQSIFPKYNSLERLHTCLMPIEEWDKCFEQNGFTKHQLIDYVNNDYRVVYKKCTQK